MVFKGIEESCFVCGEDNRHVLQRHHRIPSRYDGADSGENIVVLCANCHQAIEKIYNAQFYAALETGILSSGSKPTKSALNLLSASSPKTEQYDGDFTFNDFSSHPPLGQFYILVNNIDSDILEDHLWAVYSSECKSNSEEKLTLLTWE